MARRGSPGLVVVWPCCDAGVRTASLARGMGDLYIARMGCARFVVGIFGFARVNHESSLFDIGLSDVRCVDHRVFYSTYTEGRTLTATPDKLLKSGIQFRTHNCEHDLAFEIGCRIQCA